MLTPTDFFDLSHFEHAAIFDGIDLIWEALQRLPSYTIQHLGLPFASLDGPEEQLPDAAAISPEASVDPGAQILGPVVVGPRCHLDAHCVLRGPVILGSDVYVGRYSEVKASILLNEAKVPHLSYVGDSIIGGNVNMGAGAVLSNLKLSWEEITVHVNGREFPTGMQKLGAILGDGVQIGCNSVLQPGTLVGPRTWVYAGAMIRGYYPPDHIVKVRQVTDVVAQRRARVPEQAQMAEETT